MYIIKLKDRRKYIYFLQVVWSIKCHLICPPPVPRRHCPFFGLPVTVTAPCNPDSLKPVTAPQKPRKHGFWHARSTVQKGWNTQGTTGHQKVILLIAWQGFPGGVVERMPRRLYNIYHAEERTYHQRLLFHLKKNSGDFKYSEVKAQYPKTRFPGIQEIQKVSFPKAKYLPF